MQSNINTVLNALCHFQSLKPEEQQFRESTSSHSKQSVAVSCKWDI